MAEKQGYVKLFRKVVDWEWYTDVNTCHLFIHMLIMANHDTQKWRGEVIERGTFITSLASLSNETGLSVRQVRTSMNHLLKTCDIEVKSTNRNTRIIIVKYDFYQCCKGDYDKPNDTQLDKQSTNTRQTSDKQATTNKNEKNLKNNKNDENKKINTSALSDSENHSMLKSNVVISLTLNDKTEFEILESHSTEWQELYPSVDIMQELRKMKGWLNANPTKRKTHRGILKFINSWLAKAQDKGGAQNAKHEIPVAGNVDEFGKAIW